MPDNDNEVMVHDTERFPSASRIESKGLNVLILRNLAEPVKNFNGDICYWELEYRWLSQMDEDLCCVQGNEFTYYMAHEVDITLGLFEQFNLF